MGSDRLPCNRVLRERPPVEDKVTDEYKGGWGVAALLVDGAPITHDAVLAVVERHQEPASSTDSRDP